jgi:BirA family biotin operon repressor/biotin-[acetyl-CoA-carboxylase] ligase
MRQRLKLGEDVHGLVIRAKIQTHGRGRQGKIWQSPPGGSYQTVGLRDDSPPHLRSPLIGLAIGIGLAKTFQRAGAKLGLKWPNDLYYKGKKIGGILTEYLDRHLLVGIGLNVSNRAPQGGTSLTGWVLGEVDHLVLEGYQRGLSEVYSHGDLIAAWSTFDLLAGQPVVVRVDGVTLGGTARGIAVDGRLSVEAPDGAIRTVGAGGLLSYQLRTE